MNQRTAIQLATKAAILAKATNCTVDETIRYLAAVHDMQEDELVKLSIVTGVPVAKLRKLADVNSSMAVC